MASSGKENETVKEHVIEGEQDKEKVEGKAERKGKHSDEKEEKGTEKAKVEGTEKVKVEGTEKAKVEGTEKAKVEGTEEKGKHNDKKEDKRKEKVKSRRKMKERVVIIAMDGSESSIHAFNTYVDVLSREGDRVVLFTCKELREVMHSTLLASEAVLTYDPELLKEHVGKEKEVAKCLLQPYVDQLTSLGVKVKPAMLVCQDAGHSIVGMAEHEEAHLIVMGSRGHGKLRRTLIGSCSDYVINHAHVPVVVCRH